MRKKTLIIAGLCIIVLLVALFVFLSQRSEQIVQSVSENGEETGTQEETGSTEGVDTEKILVSPENPTGSAEGTDTQTILVSPENPTAPGGTEGGGDTGNSNPTDAVPVGGEETDNSEDASLYTYYGYFGGNRRNGFDTSEFLVIPEYPMGTILALAAFFAALVAFKSKRIAIHL